MVSTELIPSPERPTTLPPHPHVTRLRKIIERRPLYIRIETVNTCNARCAFCAYCKTRRPKSIMPLDLFQKVVADYDAIGGGAVSLTPIVGEALLDPQLCDRLRILRRNPAITAVSLVSNAIAWERYSAADQRFILQSLDRIDISIGGLDASSYRRMFRVDAFDRVHSAVRAMSEIKLRCALATEINLEFRVDRPLEELMADPRMDAFRLQGISSINAMNTFGNWGGMVRSEDVPQGARVMEPADPAEQGRQPRPNACFVYYMSPAVTSDGLLTACGCMNAEAEEPIIGDVKTTSLKDIWSGAPLRRFRASFGTDTLPHICARCTSYQDGHTWLHNPALARFVVGDDPWDMVRRHAPPPPPAALSQALRQLVGHGYKRLAVYGAGRFTELALASMPRMADECPLVAIIDDDPRRRGRRLGGLPVTSSEEALNLHIDAVVVGSQWYAWELWHASFPLRAAGIQVIPLDPGYLSPPDPA